MKTITKTIVVAGLLAGSATSSNAAVIGFDLSPAGTDNALGLSPLNETGLVVSSGSGNEIGTGITFDMDTLTLSLSLAYGSAFGFGDLTAPASAAHIHGPAPTNTAASVLINLAGIHVPAADPSTGGSYVGAVTLTAAQAIDLLAGLHYINIHTTNFPGGEIRAQLIPVNVLPTLVCPTSTNAECAGPNGTFVQISAQVADEDGDPLTVVWSANGFALQTNSIPAGTTNLTAVTFSGTYQLGTNVVTVSVSDGVDAEVSCSANVIVRDTTPPAIVSASITPNVLWPPNHKMIPVQVSLVATDLCGTVSVTRIKSITSNQHVLAKGSGKKSPDWKITGDLTAELRAERTGKDKSGRYYTVTVEAIDDSGNASTTDLTVWVPHDQRKAPAVVSNNGNSNGNSNNDGSGNSGNSNAGKKNKKDAKAAKS